jgi:hypothetical protein
MNRIYHSDAHNTPDSLQHKHNLLKEIPGGWRQDQELLQKVPSQDVNNLDLLLKETINEWSLKEK